MSHNFQLTAKPISKLNSAILLQVLIKHRKIKYKVWFLNVGKKEMSGLDKRVKGDIETDLEEIAAAHCLQNLTILGKCTEFKDFSDKASVNGTKRYFESPPLPITFLG